MSDGISDGWPFGAPNEEMSRGALVALLAKHNMLGLRKDAEIARLRDALAAAERERDEAKEARASTVGLRDDALAAATRNMARAEAAEARLRECAAVARDAIERLAGQGYGLDARALTKNLARALRFPEDPT